MLVQGVCNTSTQNPNVFQMSPVFKGVSEGLTKETKCEHGSVLTLEWLLEDRPESSLGTCPSSLRALQCQRCQGSQIPWCQRGVCSRAGMGDGLNEDGTDFGREGSALSHETPALPMLSSCWEYGPVVVRALGGGDWYPRSGQAVDLPCDFGQAGSCLCTFPQQGLLYPFTQSQAVAP